MPTVPKRRGWLDKEFAEYEIAAIVSAAITRGAILSTSDPFTISTVRSTESPRGDGDRQASERASEIEESERKVASS